MLFSGDGCYIDRGGAQLEFHRRSKHHIPAVAAAFTVESLLAATGSVLRQKIEGKPFLDNCYRSLVRPGGNPLARKHMQETLDVVDANWRGIGLIPESGFALQDAYAALGARSQFPDFNQAGRCRMGEMPPGYDCANVVLGRIYPNQSRLTSRYLTSGPVASGGAVRQRKDKVQMGSESDRAMV